MEKSDKNNRWLQGYSCAIACIINMDDAVNTLTKEAYSAGIGNKTEKELIEAGVDDCDIETFKKHELI